MRQFIVPAMLAASLALAGAASAAPALPQKTQPVSVVKATPQEARLTKASTAKPAAMKTGATGAKSKAAACMRKWDTMRTHGQNRAKFMAACEKA